MPSGAATFPRYRVRTRRLTRFRRLCCIPEDKLFRFRDGVCGVVVRHQHDGNALVLKAGEPEAREIRGELLVVVDCREVAA